MTGNTDHLDDLLAELLDAWPYLTQGAQRAVLSFIADLRALEGGR